MKNNNNNKSTVIAKVKSVTKSKNKLLCLVIISNSTSPNHKSNNMGASIPPLPLQIQQQARVKLHTDLYRYINRATAINSTRNYHLFNDNNNNLKYSLSMSTPQSQKAKPKSLPSQLSNFPLPLPTGRCNHCMPLSYMPLDVHSLCNKSLLLDTVTDVNFNLNVND